MTFKTQYLKIQKYAQEELSIIESKILLSLKTREPLNKILNDLIKAPSKHIRSLIVILFNKMMNIKISDNHLELLSSVELVHTASLIHDDIIDNSEYRRGIKTISAQLGNKLGVISGDYLLAIAMNKIANLNSTEILKEFSKTLYQMCIGEINQNFDKFKIGNIENYIEKSKNKTGYLFETALYCSGIINNFGKEELNHLKSFAMNFGIAFQIRDDLNNLLKTEDFKPTQNDIKEGIYNAPVIYANSAKDYTSGIEKTRDLLNNYINICLEELKNYEENEYKQALEELLELLKND